MERETSVIDGRKHHRQLAALVRRTQEGDHTAFEELYSLTAQAQYFTMVGKVGVDAASDLLQELYLVAWRNIGSIHPDALIGYLNATTRNLCRRHLSRQSTSQAPIPYSDEFLEDAQGDREPLFGAESTADPAIGTSNRDQAAHLAAALHHELDDQEREALVLRYYQRLKLAEVAAALGVSKATVKRIVARALDKLRSKLSFVPMGAALSQAMAAAVESSVAPGVPLKNGDWHHRTSASERAFAGIAAAAAIIIAFAGFTAIGPRPEAAIPEDPSPLADPETLTSQDADTHGPRLLETFVEGDTTILQLEDASGVARVMCEDAAGHHFTPLATTGISERDPVADSDPAPEPTSEPASVSEWHFVLPDGTYTIHATDTCGNFSTGTVIVHVTPDPLADI